LDAVGESTASIRHQRVFELRQRGFTAILGNKTVRIYAVRTPLSRYLFEGSDCAVDCLAAPDLEKVTYGG
jgi:hypothetical protein